MPSYNDGKVTAFQVFGWREGSRFSGDAQVVGEHLHKLRDKFGDQGISPDVVLKDAISDKSPLHPYFEWNNSEAAKQYRLSQARHLLAAVVIVKGSGAKQKTIRAFIHIDRETEYRPIAEALSQKSVRIELIKQALHDLENMQQRYGHLKELVSVFDAAEEVRKAVAAEIELQEKTTATS